MTSSLHLRLSNAEKTRSAGASLAHSLYNYPVTIELIGELGAGKTTFLQGFAEQLGITEPLTSPTYALEQRYDTALGLPLIHLDLYRLKERDAADLIASTDDHEGIRCIEWADRLPDMVRERSALTLTFVEDGDGRILTLTCGDTILPREKDIDDWRAELMLPSAIGSHCDIVATVCDQLADTLIANGQIVRKEALHAAARLHDLFRFVDFKGIPEGITNTVEETQTWTTWKERYPDIGHEALCTLFLREKGYDVVASIIETHGLRPDLKIPGTVEQKLLFYADKRCIVDRIVTIDERFDDFAIRYGGGKKSDLHLEWFAITKKLEQELFPNGINL